MVEYVYRCDRCRKETKEPIRIYGCIVDTETNRVKPEADPPKQDFCPECYRALVSFINAGAEEDEKQESEEKDRKEDPRQKPEKAKEETKGAEKTVAKKTRDRIAQLYKNGAEMEEIERVTGVPMYVISRVIDQEGLGKERYKGQLIQSDGSAPVANVKVDLQGRVKRS